MLVEAAMSLVLQSSTGEFKPLKIDPYALCRCPAVDQTKIVTFTGTASDAEMRLGEDGLSTAPRQATIFRVLKKSSADIADFARVYHLTDPAKCGITFEYGKRYDVTAVKTDGGALETDWCVMGKPRAPE